MGALTSKPYAFTARPWELSEREAFDIFDPFGSSVKLSLRGKEVIRVLPNVRFSLGEEWISDSSRFSYDSILSKSRLRNIIISLGSTSAGKKQICFSITWLKDFLNPRLQDISMPDHFCLSYVSTVQFFHHFFGFSGFGGRLSVYDTRLFPYSQLNSLYSALTKGVSNLFLFNLNLRYTFPTVSVKLRQLASSGNSGTNIFNLSSTVNNLLNETNVACGPKSLVGALRFKSRISRVLLLPSSYALFGFDTSVFFGVYVSKYLRNYSIFYNNAAAVTFSEFGLDARSVTLCSLIRSDSGFLSAILSTNYGITSDFAYDVVIPVSHPYEDYYSYYLSGKTVTYTPAISFQGESSASPHFPFSFKLSYYPSFTPSVFHHKLDFINIVSGKSFGNFANYITHFLGDQFQQNSINILLNVKRHNEFRSNYIYYL